MQLLTNVRKTDDKNQLFIVCLYLTTFFRAVDNWSFYSEALSPEVDFRDISSDIIEKIFLEYEKDYAEKWKNYQKMKFALHEIESTQ